MIIPATVQPAAPLVVRPTRSAQGPSIENRQPKFFILKLPSVKIKKCVAEATHRKTHSPIVKVNDTTPICKNQIILETAAFSLFVCCVTMTKQTDSRGRLSLQI